MELGLLAPFSAPSSWEWDRAVAGSSPDDLATLSRKHAVSSTQLTLNKLSVKPREMPIITGPTGLSSETSVENLILRVPAASAPSTTRRMKKKKKKKNDKKEETWVRTTTTTTAAVLVE